jgi:hypothetical protein
MLPHSEPSPPTSSILAPVKEESLFAGEASRSPRRNSARNSRWHRPLLAVHLLLRVCLLDLRPLDCHPSPPLLPPDWLMILNREGVLTGTLRRVHYLEAVPGFVLQRDLQGRELDAGQAHLGLFYVVEQMLVQVVFTCEVYIAVPASQRV